MHATELARRAIFITVVAWALSVASAPATTNQQLSVTGNVIGDCTTIPTTNTLAFGSYSPFSATDVTVGPVAYTFNCTRGDTNLNFSVSGGQNFTHANPSGSRAMKDATNNFLTYQLYQTTGSASPWAFNVVSGLGTAVTLTAGGISTPNTVNLYGIIPHGQTSGATAPDIGNYSDQVTVTVNY